MNTTITLMQAQLRKVIKLKNYIDDPILIVQLKPKLSHSIHIDEKKFNNRKIFWIRNIYTNKLLAEISSDEMQLISLFNGNITIHELISKLDEKHDKKSFLDFIKALWELHIIIYKFD